MFSALVFPLVQPSSSPEDVWELIDAHKPSKRLWGDTQGCSQELSTTTAVSYNYKPTSLVGPGSSPIRTAQSSSGPAPLRAASYR